MSAEPQWRNYSYTVLQLWQNHTRLFARLNIVLLTGLLISGMPNKVVLADSVNCFKSRLDKFWQNQDIVYNFRAEIEGTRNRSEV